MNPIKVGKYDIGQGQPLALIAGPCVIEDHQTARRIAADLKAITRDLNIPYIFKASYDKANRTSATAFRGPGLVDGLQILAEIKKELDLPVLSDVHRISEIAQAARVLDILQIPAFLSRQTDLLTEAARSVFGYNNLVVDFRGLMIMRQSGYPVIFDATHSVQLPGGAGGSSGGQREYAPVLARAAVAAGVDGVFIEVHHDPDRARCDGPNSLRIDAVHHLLSQLKTIHQAINAGG
jgi:2-dehydro-3-deoxyphosphooctonate aldolase (KDO 8-P synthase)